ncbi:MAG: hypothetical protein QCH35_07415 [Methanomicrobiaceae archaeon]|nr:hypothetical protein [Methanomicrobiaceae archaeon]
MTIPSSWADREMFEAGYVAGQFGPREARIRELARPASSAALWF